MTQNDIKDNETEGVAELRHRLKGAMNPEMYADTKMFIRFLRARNHDINAAEHMLRNHINWRKTHRIDTLLQWFKPTEVAKKYIALSHMGYDKEGSPVMYDDIGNLDCRGILKSIKITDYSNSIISLLESDNVRLKEQSQKLNKEVDQWVHVINFENFSLSVATHKPSLQAIGSMVSLYEANYPERLKLAVIINTSWYFQIGYAIIKPLITAHTQKKIKIYGKDGWQEELRELMNPEDLPSFLGGNKTDPNGDPMCRKFLIHGNPVPESYFAENRRVPLASQPGVKHLSVSRLSKVQVEFPVLYPGSEIEWEFETKGKDIAFTLLYKESKCCGFDPKELLPKQRVDTTVASECGIYSCEKAGIYYLEFDNTYSWVHQKEVFYKVKVTTPHVQSKGA